MEEKQQVPEMSFFLCKNWGVHFVSNAIEMTTGNSSFWKAATVKTIAVEKHKMDKNKIQANFKPLAFFFP